MLIKQSHIWRDSEFWDAPFNYAANGIFKRVWTFSALQSHHAFEMVRPIIDMSVN